MKLRTLATALCYAATMAVAVAHEEPSFRLLNLDGYAVRWNTPARGPLVLTYKVVNKDTPIPRSRTCGTGLTSFDRVAADAKISVETVKAEVTEAVRMWEAVANVKFVESEGDDADVLLGAQNDPNGYAFADVYFDPAAAGEYKPITKGLVCINPERPWKVGFGGDRNAYDLRFTFAHEIGHVLGLDHPKDSGGQLMGFKYHERFRTLQAGDVFAARILYGMPATVMVEKR